MANKFNISRWMSVSIGNFMIVGIIGMLMRYKIGFEFPHLDQKNLQHAHSHFAFSGWVSQALMALMIALLQEEVSASRSRHYNNILLANLFLSFGMLFSFALQGYGLVSIILSSLSILLAVYFIFLYWGDLALAGKIKVKSWLKAAMVFNLISMLGTLSLVYMMSTKTIEQQAYLASVYWYLHFQYNGWFFFACLGLFLQFLADTLNLSIPNSLFWKFALSCMPVYGLSVLWLHLPMWIYCIIIVATLVQTLAWLQLSTHIYKSNLLNFIQKDNIGKWLLIFLTIAIFTKFALQLGSVLPSLSKLAFGFRPIVIAYLHLVLLAIISVFLISIGYLRGYLHKNTLTHAGIWVLLSGIFLNEAALAIQGIASFSYTLIPNINTMLFIIAILLVIGILLLFLGQTAKLKANSD